MGVRSQVINQRVLAQFFLTATCDFQSQVPGLVGAGGRGSRLFYRWGFKAPSGVAVSSLWRNGAKVLQGESFQAERGPVGLPAAERPSVVCTLSWGRERHPSSAPERTAAVPALLPGGQLGAWGSHEAGPHLRAPSSHSWDLASAPQRFCAILQALRGRRRPWVPHRGQGKARRGAQGLWQWAAGWAQRGVPKGVQRPSGRRTQACRRGEAQSALGKLGVLRRWGLGQLLTCRASVGTRVPFCGLLATGTGHLLPVQRQQPHGSWAHLPEISHSDKPRAARIIGFEGAPHWPPAVQNFGLNAQQCRIKGRSLSTSFFLQNKTKQPKKTNKPKT